MISIKNFKKEQIQISDTNIILGGDTTMTCWEDVGCDNGDTIRYHQVTNDDGAHLGSYTTVMKGIKCEIIIA